MAEGALKMHIIADLTKDRAEEIGSCIMILAQTSQDSLTTLKQVDIWLGEHIAILEQRPKPLGP
ncbi:hypothetical protein [Paenibacillus radicis (ex Xue et al. 2023)]|uniref:Uncharacterized protein n=1 Tax=Paenibacillus radicis (ex Xue et al. 2023) TaxID=2972489 RepID=A0ABT1YJY5_9BACL|nr:hypothetical protein [Paenibacillus radicis (ex Xue et al. 2023)]MCR8633503.1 hypothetical protein [Paenibacillus radicis (ex Xue et al. 2023)]